MRQEFNRGLLHAGLLLVAVVIVGVVALGAARPAAANADWHDTSRHFRIPITIDANNLARQDAVAEIDLDLGRVLSDLGYPYPPLGPSVKVVEVNGSRAVIDDSVVFQYDPTTNGKGILSLLMSGNTPASTTRRYDVYFDISGDFGAPTFTDLVALSNTTDEGFASYRLDGANSTLYYHIQGAGFSGLVDTDGVDWISWNKASGPAGDFRGVPNLVHPADGGYFHPGRKTAVSSISADGPLKVTILSASKDNTWKARWDIFPTHARMTIMEKPDARRYWFQYEGTPGGSLTDADRVYRSDGREVRGLGKLVRDIGAAEEWMYVADAASGPQGRSLFMLHHRDDALVDSYRPLGSMTIMAFGRDGANGRFFSETGEQFSIGLVDSTNGSTVSEAIRQISTPLVTGVGAAAVNGTPTPPQPPVEPVVLKPSHDGYVDSAMANRSYGNVAVLRVRDTATDLVSYLKFDVTGLAAAPARATLRLFVTDPGPDGGAVYLVDNHYSNTATAWLEAGLTWNNRPLLLSREGAPNPIAPSQPGVKGRWLEYDVTAAVTSVGTYSFSLASTSKDLVAYASSESKQSPELVIIPTD